MKTIRPEVLGDGDSETQLARFEREARITAALNHPNVVQIIDYGRDEPSGQVFLAMELLDGRSLKEVLKAEGPLSPQRVAHLIAQTASALKAAHDKQIVHRDLKPANAMIVTGPAGEEVVKLIDLGISKLDASAGDISPEESIPGYNAKITRTGDIIGTPQYLAPEVAVGEPITAAADLYSLGVMTYELLTGQKPFRPGRTAIETLRIVVTEDPVPITRHAPRLAEYAELWPLLESTLAKEPGARPGSVMEFAEKLSAALSREAHGPDDSKDLADTVTLDTSSPALTTQDTTVQQPRVPMVEQAQEIDYRREDTGRAKHGSGYWSRQARFWVIAAAGGFLVLLLSITLFWLFGSQENQDPVEKASSTASSPDNERFSVANPDETRRHDEDQAPDSDTAAASEERPAQAGEVELQRVVDELSASVALGTVGTSRTPVSESGGTQFGHTGEGKATKAAGESVTKGGRDGKKQQKTCLIRSARWGQVHHRGKQLSRSGGAWELEGSVGSEYTVTLIQNGQPMASHTFSIPQSGKCRELIR